MTIDVIVRGCSPEPSPPRLVARLSDTAGERAGRVGRDWAGRYCRAGSGPHGLQHLAGPGRLTRACWALAILAGVITALTGLAAQWIDYQAVSSLWIGSEKKSEC